MTNMLRIKIYTCLQLYLQNSLPHVSFTKKKKNAGWKFYPRITKGFFNKSQIITKGLLEVTKRPMRGNILTNHSTSQYLARKISSTNPLEITKGFMSVFCLVNPLENGQFLANSLQFY